MVKHHEYVKVNSTSLERQALEWIRSLAFETGAFEVLSSVAGKAESPSREQPWDIVVQIQPHVANPQPLTMYFEVRSRLTPQEALGILERCTQVPAGGIPVLCVPAISERVAQLCRAAGVSHLDEAGNCRVVGPGLFVERSGRGNARPDTRRQKALFASRSSRIVRALLDDPTVGWQVQELADVASVSLGLASKMKQALIEQGFAVQYEKLLYLRDPAELLRAWAREYRSPTTPVSLYLDADLPQAEKMIGQWCQTHEIPYALTQFSAAWRVAPTVRYHRATLYVARAADRDWDGLLQDLDAKRVDSGANVVLWPTEDVAVFRGERKLGNPALACVSPVQLYLDLQSIAGRGEDAALAVYEAELAPLYSHASPATRGEFAPGDRP